MRFRSARNRVKSRREVFGSFSAFPPQNCTCLTPRRIKAKPQLSPFVPFNGINEPPIHRRMVSGDRWPSALQLRAWPEESMGGYQPGN